MAPQRDRSSCTFDLKRASDFLHMNRTPKVMVVFGTRPEAIKMAPVVRALKRYDGELHTVVVVTAQHRCMLDQMLGKFSITPDYDLDVMAPGQSLTEITVRVLSRLEAVILAEQPDLMLVQGDTTTAFVGGLAAFYHRIPVGHVEAGLRTRNKYNPFPEEVNRHLLDVFADLCFAPTLTAKQALLSEGVLERKILVTGNTVIDALLTAVDLDHQFTCAALGQLDFKRPRRTLLVTSHRRESFGAPLKQVCHALRDLLQRREELQLVFPVHLNPQVRSVVWPILGDLDRAFLLEPLDYFDFVRLMRSCDVIVTDSGGIQEEAPALGKPVLVTRADTERPEAVLAGAARVVGTDREHIVAAVDDLLDHARMQNAVSPYGDGYAADRVVGAVRHFLGLVETPPLPFVNHVEELKVGLDCLPA
jgi:UDP-N-acetylglucosamine 2-epimerase (non-hydrolysing)